VSRNPGREAGQVVTGRWQRRDDPGADQAGLRQWELRDDPGGLLPTGKREITPGTQHLALCLRHESEGLREEGADLRPPAALHDRLAAVADVHPKGGAV
jgi:hypothetical protein